MAVFIATAGANAIPVRYQCRCFQYMHEFTEKYEQMTLF